MTAFPRGRHDDQVDSTAQMLDWTQQTNYDQVWHSFASGVSTQSGAADTQYYLSAMTLKTMQDKSNGAMIAGIGTPWGPSVGDNDAGGYHLVWSRDMYKFANALFTSGDTASATNAVNWLFNVDMDQSTGRFPQNAYVDGTPNSNATQMDEQVPNAAITRSPRRETAAPARPIWPH
jgi:glucoamylase